MEAGLKVRVQQVKVGLEPDTQAGHLAPVSPDECLVSFLAVHALSRCWLQCVRSSPRGWSLSWDPRPAQLPAPSSATSAGRRR